MENDWKAQYEHLAAFVRDGKHEEAAKYVKYIDAFLALHEWATKKIRQNIMNHAHD